MRKLICTTSLFVGIPAMTGALLFGINAIGQYYEWDKIKLPLWLSQALGWTFLLFLIGVVVAGILIPFWKLCSTLCADLRGEGRR